MLRPRGRVEVNVYETYNNRFGKVLKELPL